MQHETCRPKTAYPALVDGKRNTVQSRVMQYGTLGTLGTRSTRCSASAVSTTIASKSDGLRDRSRNFPEVKHEEPIHRQLPPCWHVACCMLRAGMLRAACCVLRVGSCTLHLAWLRAAGRLAHATCGMQHATTLHGACDTLWFMLRAMLYATDIPRVLPAAVPSMSSRLRTPRFAAMRKYSITCSAVQCSAVQCSAASTDVSGVWYGMVHSVCRQVGCVCTTAASRILYVVRGMTRVRYTFQHPRAAHQCRAR
jgi:hypothetical protein